ncbi:MAG: acyl-ACP--UDP-N-acetylglucosamine O-acyltransferase [Phycisphaerales bacterium]|nr:acyl-ACP--UDP-N-acetylglucosamine O-acyltransferase [Phycisphaerales bacterium]
MTTHSEIHPSAVIDVTAEVDSTTTIGPGCVIGPNVRIGPHNVLINHVTVQCNTTIGSGNTFYPFSVVGSDPQDKKYNGEMTTLEIGDRNEIREHVTIHRGTGSGCGKTVIGCENLLMVGCHVAHDCILGNEIILANQVMLAGHVIVDDGAAIGGGTGVNQFSAVGRCAYVGGLARITKDVPPYMIVEGTPAEVRAVNVVAMTRRGYSEPHIEATKEAFRRLFRENGGSILDRMEAVLADLGAHQSVVTLCKALRASNDGKHGRSNEKK